MGYKYDLYVYQAALKFYKSLNIYKSSLAKAINDIICYYSKEKTHNPENNNICQKLEYVNKILDSYVSLKFVDEIKARNVRGGGWPRVVAFNIPKAIGKQILKEHKEIQDQLKKQEEKIN